MLRAGYRASRGSKMARPFRNIALGLLVLANAGCATQVKDPPSDLPTPVAVSFSDHSTGECTFTDKRRSWTTLIPATVTVRPSDGPLHWRCKTEDGRSTDDSIPRTADAKTEMIYLEFFY